jgi:hypothetical protein
MSRPPFFENPEQLQAMIDEYFNTPRKPTISGLALFLGFADRHSFYDYEKKEEFTHTIKRARARIAQHFEELIQGNQAAGGIFMLKNLGYTDKQEIDLNANVVEMPTIKKDGKDLHFDIGTAETPGHTGETSTDS